MSKSLQRAQSLLEFALVLPVIFTLLLGSVIAWNYLDGQIAINLISQESALLLQRATNTSNIPYNALSVINSIAQSFGLKMTTIKIRHLDWDTRGSSFTLMLSASDKNDLKLIAAHNIFMTSTAHGTFYPFVNHTSNYDAEIDGWITRNSEPVANVLVQCDTFITTTNKAGGYSCPAVKPGVVTITIFTGAYLKIVHILVGPADIANENFEI